MGKHNRRDFIKSTAMVGGAAVVSTTLLQDTFGLKTSGIQASDLPADGWIRTGCPAHNCGGRCLLKVKLEKGRITRIETDDRPGDTPADPQLRACIRGRSYRRRQEHPDRLKYPMIRTGKRGEGKFRQATWDEALDKMAAEMKRIRESYGNESMFVPYGTGSYSHINGRWPAVRLMNLFGGALDYYNSYSWACISKATPTVYGTAVCGSQRQDWLNSRYILMWGWNPAEMRDGTNSDYFIKLARRNGAKVVCIDPRMTMSAVALADEWIPIRPGTDTALMSAMAYVMVRDGIYDKEFVDSHCIGFDSSQMPKGFEKEESYKDYLLGTFDGTPKTPEWASKITGIQVGVIERIAIEFATTKPAMLYQGYGMQRRAYGEQPVRGGCVLAAITGNVGNHGGWASGIALQPNGPFWSIFPTFDNPVKAKIPTFLWSEAVIRGTSLTAKEGLTGVERLNSNIKMIWAVASNILVNQHGNSKRASRILEDESLVELIVVQDQFMTESGKFADIILPACTHFETWGLQDGWKYGEEIILLPQLMEPYAETRSDYRICADLAGKLGLKEEYTEGLDEKGWTRRIWNDYRARRFPQMPDFDQFVKSNQGAYTVAVTDPAISFEKFRIDPKAHPLPTESGKIEIFSAALFRMEQPESIPAVPKYIQEWESPFGPEAREFPLQAIGPHYMARVHSTHDNVDWLKEAFPQRVFMNPGDAEARKLKDGDPVKVFNERGTLVIPCRITPRIMPGVVSIPQGAWTQSGKNGYDFGGNINNLSSERWSPLAFGNAQHTIMVQAEKFTG